MIQGFVNFLLTNLRRKKTKNAYVYTFFLEQAEEKNNQVSIFFLLQRLSGNRCFSTDTALMHEVFPRQKRVWIKP